MPGSRLTLQQREIIARGVGLGLSQKAIAEATGIAGPSVRRGLTRLREEDGYVELDGGPGRRTKYSVLPGPPALGVSAGATPEQ